MSEREETEGIKKNKNVNPYLLQGYQALPNCKQISVGSPSDASYTTPLPQPTTPFCACSKTHFSLDVVYN